MKTGLLITFLVALLAVSLAGFVAVWRLGGLPHISMHGWIALGLGSVLSLALGAGLMALAFFSARHGHDEAADQLTRGVRRPDPGNTPAD